MTKPMKIKQAEPLPLIKKSPLLLYLDIILMLLMILVVSTVYYGLRVLSLTAVSVFCAMLSDNLLSRLFKIHHHMDFSSTVTGMMIAMLMPVSVPYYVVALASTFGIIISKIPFGGTGKNIFNPAALGFCFVSLVFHNKVYSYPAAGSRPSLFFPNVSFSKSPAEYVADFSRPHTEITDIISGRFPSALGCGFSVLIIAAFLILVFRRRNILYSIISYIITFTIFIAILPRIPANLGERIILELCSGCVLFCGVFMLNDPVTSPRTPYGKIFFGLFAACITVILGFLTGIIFAAPFAILICNIFSHSFDCLYFILEKNGHKKSKAS